jgi:hypothetical protein
MIFLAFFLILTPDRAPLPDEWGYRPADASTVTLNPPSLTWVHEKGAASYQLQWSATGSFNSPTTIDNISWSAYTHSAPLKPGAWFWRYRIIAHDGGQSAWSRARRFTIAKDAVEFPQPTMDELTRRIPQDHPRLFLRRQDLPNLRAYAQGAGLEPWNKLKARADSLAAAQPTAEPAIRASASDPATNQFWWSNRVQTVRAAQEAEILALVYLISGDAKYAAPARRNLLALAAWDPDGSTNFRVNCEAAKPLVHRLARAYDWAWDTLTDEDRRTVRAMLLRRGLDAWNSWEANQGAGHLNQPYGSHANRLWHKLAENAVATLGELPEASQWLHYAVTKFYAAYPVWSDDDGGWHEGLSYLAGYMSKAAWWMELARTPLGIDAFKKPFFRQLGDYALYSAPPGSPDLGMGDLSFRPPGQGWSFLNYYARRTSNPYWTWWLEQWGATSNNDEPALGFLWSAQPAVAPKPPTALPVSKLFEGTGVAILNTTLLNSADNVQVRFKSSPMGRWSHGHEPNNSFTLNAYGEALLVNNVYRDLYGSPFHKGWVWTSRAQNAMLVDGGGQKPRAKDAIGRIVTAQLQDGFDYVLGEAAQAYAKPLPKALRHVLFVKPDLVILVDEAEATNPAQFQWMLHGQKPFTIDPSTQRLTLNTGKAGIEVSYFSEDTLQLRQWTGYDPEPDHRYLRSINSSGIPPQWHVEAASTTPRKSTFTITAARVYRAGMAPASPLQIERKGAAIQLRSGSAQVRLYPAGTQFAEVTRDGRTWKIPRN